MPETNAIPSLEEAAQLQRAAVELSELALARSREVTAGGKRIDDHQVLVERVVYAATQARAITELVEAVSQAAAEARGPGRGPRRGKCSPKPLINHKEY